MTNGRAMTRHLWVNRPERRRRRSTFKHTRRARQRSAERWFVRLETTTLMGEE